MKKKTAVESRVHAWFTGRVQGVGFRYTAEKMALEIGLTGWVKNLPDGRVEMVCEGPREKIELLLERIQESPMGHHIQKTQRSWEAATGEFRDFNIEFHF